MNWIKRNNAVKGVKDAFLSNHDLSSLDEINDWFRKSYAHNYRIDLLKEAVAFVKTFKDKKVTIVGDYDCDGVTSTSILYMALRHAGFTNVSYRIPKRFTEGFGINPTIVDEINEGLIITCDNGIAQTDVIRMAKKKGLSVVVIDHHQPEVNNGNVVLPNADINIDPNAIENSADFAGYCAAGLTYRFACELLDYEKPFCDKLLGLAAIGTIGDVMELKEENYVIVRNGLKVLVSEHLCTKGLHALLSSCELSSSITSKDVGFTVAPILNAVSRLNDEGANDSVSLLIYDDDETEAVRQAVRLIEINKKRKEYKAQGIDKAHEIIEAENIRKDIPMLIYVPDVKEGIVGIIAGSLCEEYKVPVIVVTNTEAGTLKGSARSCGNYNVKEKLDEVSYLLLEYGGHAGAAGLSLKKEHLDILRKELINNATDFENESVNDIYYDIDISVDEIKDALLEMGKYEPYGEGNPLPVFRVNGFVPSESYGAYKKLIGADKTTVKISCGKVSAIGFHMADAMQGLAEDDSPIDIIGTLSFNTFKGMVTPQIEIIDAKRSA
ncbi:MAG: DHH family phosphoesterase [Lachnospiraceae bacterium]|nr:DHH family phosphoesterase [Lachnospiraceae bacterium]